MAINKDPIFIGNLAGKLTSFTSANGTGSLDITTVDSNGPIRVDSLSIANDDTNPGVMQLSINNGSTTVPVAMIAIPANSLLNTGANAPLDVLAHVNVDAATNSDAAANKFIEIPTGWKLIGTMISSPTSGKTFYVQARWGTYAA